jgi:hypothetical protein
MQAALLQSRKHQHAVYCFKINLDSNLQRLTTRKEINDSNHIPAGSILLDEPAVVCLGSQESSV